LQVALNYSTQCHYLGLRRCGKSRNFYLLRLKK
jgi:hypothetical protein